MALDFSQAQPVKVAGSTSTDSISPQSGGNSPQLGGTQTSQNPAQPPSTTNPWVDNLPNIAGLVGSVGGRLLGGIGGAVGGTAVEPGGGTVLGAIGGEEAGGGAGGALGQGFGEWLKEKLDNKPANVGEITKQGAIGGVFGAIPGAEAESGLVKKIGGGILSQARVIAGTGAVTGAVTKGIEEIGSKDSLPAKVGNVVNSAISNAAGFLIFRSALGVGDSALSFLGEKVPQDLKDAALKTPVEVASIIYNKVKETLVGHDNIDTLQKYNILPEKMALTTQEIRDVLGNVKDTATKVENEFQSKISGVKIGLQDKAINGQSLVDIIQGVPKLVEGTRASSIMHSLSNAIPKEQWSAGSIDGSAITEMKRALNSYYSTPGVPEIRAQLNNFVRQASGVPDKVKELSDDAFHLSAASGQLKKLLNTEKTPSLPANLSPQSIEKAISDAAKGIPNSMDAVLSSLALVTYMGIGSGVKELSSAGLGVGAAFGIRSVLQKVGNLIAESPERKLKIADFLQQMYKAAKLGGSDKAVSAIEDFMQQAGIRISGSGNPPTTKKSGGLLSNPIHGVPGATSPQLRQQPQRTMPISPQQ